MESDPFEGGWDDYRSDHSAIASACASSLSVKCLNPAQRDAFETNAVSTIKYSLLIYKLPSIACSPLPPPISDHGLLIFHRISAVFRQGQGKFIHPSASHPVLLRAHH